MKIEGKKGRRGVPAFAKVAVVRKTYTIRQDPTREKKGLKSWGAFEQGSADFQKGISQFRTIQEALAAKTALKKQEIRGT
jgi:hypothetical protein